MRIALTRLISLHRIPHRVSIFPGAARATRRYVSNRTSKLLDLQSVPPEEATPEALTNELTASFMEFMDLAKIAENIIHFLFERRLFDQAIAVYQHMLDDGFIPSPSTDALILAVTLKASTAPGPNQLEGFKTILAYQSFTETHFMELLEHVVGLEVPPDTAALLTRLFISVKGDEYTPSRTLILKLIDLQTSAGHIEEAAETIDEYDVHLNSQSTFDSWAEPYARMINAAPVSDQAAVDWIMGAMREKDIPIHAIVFNALIARSKKDLRKSFAFYGVFIRLAATTPLKPDPTTYKHLFRVLGYFFKNDYRPNVSRRGSDIGNVVPPRQLFSDMMALWFSTRFHPPAAADPALRRAQRSLDQSLLDIAFRTFLYLDDYPAALVVLRVVSELGLAINERTYFILLRYMARRVYYDVYVSRAKLNHVRGPRKRLVTPRFALELLGPFDHRALPHNPNVAYRWLVKRLLENNCERSKKAEGAGEAEVPAATWRGRIPTVAQILDQENNISGDRIDHFPLVAILRRAVQLRPVQLGISQIPWGDAWRDRTLRKVRFQMVPHDVPMWTWPQPESSGKKKK
ncbi:hypothetical protein B0H17DRAFT_1074062 [Mycena rosella]|uniref:Uncharacterized protein n=1 Tax=Mycena rosella TaxID=1033263 RepID=A0AAD7GAN0_MYCRO|nr:hypothetical protein B0H17DRAFT_1074062 [Mycena rosella]